MGSWYRVPFQSGKRGPHKQSFVHKSNPRNTKMSVFATHPTRGAKRHSTKGGFCEAFNSKLGKKWWHPINNIAPKWSLCKPFNYILKKVMVPHKKTSRIRALMFQHTRVNLNTDLWEGRITPLAERKNKEPLLSQHNCIAKWHVFVIFV